MAAETVVLRTEDDALRFVAGFHRKVLVWAGQELPISSFREQLDAAEQVCEEATREFGRDRWLLACDCGVPMSREAPNVANLLFHLAETGVQVLQLSVKRAPPIPGVRAVWEGTELLALLHSPVLLRHVCGVVSLGVTDAARRAVELGLPLRVAPCGYVGSQSVRRDEEWLRAVASSGASLGRAASGGAGASTPKSPLPALRAAADAPLTVSLRSSTRAEEGIVLSMHQPWASLLVCGVKRVEGRTWPSDFRGRLWIHAAAHTPSPEEVASVCDQYRALYASASGVDVEAFLPRSWPTSCLVGCVDVVAVVPQAYRDAPAFRSLPPSLRAEFESPFCFLCENPQRSALLPMGGSHKLWKLPSDVLDVALSSLEPVRDVPEPAFFPREPPRDTA